jgi:hypothetical protein
VIIPGGDWPVAATAGQGPRPPADDPDEHRLHPGGSGPLVEERPAPPAAVAADPVGAGQPLVALSEWLRALTARVRTGLATRHSWWRELVAILGGYWLYELTRGAAAGKRSVAFAHGLAIYHFEQRLHIDPEKALNRALSPSHVLSEIASYYYGTLHFILTVVVLAVLWWRRPTEYGELRTVVVLVSLVCLLIFWLAPVAPPRFAVPGMIDTLTQTDAIGARSERGIFSLANLYAAMPSLHVAWASWVALVVTVTSRRRWVRWIAWLYPAFTIWVVLATANHYVLDVVAGVAVLLLSAVATRLYLYGSVHRVLIVPDVSGGMPAHDGQDAGAA